MADYPNISLESQLIGRGLNPSSPSTTYTDFADRIAKNMRDQAQMEQTLATAKETLKQSKLSGKQKEEAAALGVNPELAGLITKEAARDHLNLLVNAKKMKVAPELIEQWYNSLPAMVQADDVDKFVTALTKAGNTLSARVYKDTAVMQDENGQDRMYNVAVRGDGTRTELFDPETGSPVFPDIIEEADEADKEEAKKILGRAKRQLAGQEARFTTQRQMFGERSWQKLQDKINTSNAPYARAIGQASVNNMRADRALTLLTKEGGLTKNEYDIVVSDLAAIFKGGVPDIVSLEHQRYATLKSRVNEIIQYALSKPEEISTPEIKARLEKITREVKEVDNDIILNYMDSVAAGYQPFIEADPERFARMINAALRNMKKPEIDLDVIKNMEKVPLGTKADEEKPVKDSSEREDKKAALKKKLGL